MAEISTIARPYAEALFRTGGGAALAEQVLSLGAVAADAQLRHLADSPKVGADMVFDIISDVLSRQGTVLSREAQNFLRTLLANGRLEALPEIAAQLHKLVAAQEGLSDARIESAYALDEAALAAVLPALERRFGRKLTPRVVVDPELIGGLRVVVGDEVLDTSVKARLQQMKAALTA
jgi:F-type H+-transporting ATPase subunit delta